MHNSTLIVSYMIKYKFVNVKIAQLTILAGYDCDITDKMIHIEYHWQ